VNTRNFVRAELYRRIAGRAKGEEERKRGREEERKRGREEERKRGREEERKRGREEDYLLVARIRP
jgi:hypothetical protein